MKTMQKRLGIGLAAVVLISGFAPLVSRPASAQDDYDDGAYSYCDRRARDEARRQASGGVIRGAIEGSVGGAVVGGILGGRRGSRRARRAGAIIGGARGRREQQRDRDEIYRREFDRCMDDNRYR